MGALRAVLWDMDGTLVDSEKLWDVAMDALYGHLGGVLTPQVRAATVGALDAGVHTIGKKILEEAGEVWLAAEHESDEALAEEISQLLYWAQVLMLSRGLTLSDVYRKL